MLETIPFTPDLTMFLGSPIGLFLTLRGAHPVFDEMRAIADANRASLIPCDEEAEPPRVFVSRELSVVVSCSSRCT
jgi:hypothetical protein